MKFIRLLNDQGKTYDSYHDLWSLVRLSGFETVEQDAIDRDRGGVLIFPANNGTAHAIASVPRPPSCRMICWQLERPLHGYEDFAPTCYDELWVSDRWLAKELKDFGYNHVKYVPVGGHAGLGGTPQDRKLWDLCHFAYVYGRRQRILQDLSAQGFTIADACWGADRDHRLARSRAGLCMHQDALPIIEPLRYTLFACWHLPLVVEPSMDYAPYAAYALDEARTAMSDPREVAAVNYDLLTTDLTFRRRVEAAL